MEKQILKGFTVFLLNCEINNLPPKYVCIYVNNFFYMSKIVALFALLLEEHIFCLLFYKWHPKTHVNSYHWGRNFFVQKVIFYMYVYTYTHTFVIYL